MPLLCLDSAFRLHTSIRESGFVKSGHRLTEINGFHGAITLKQLHAVERLQHKDADSKPFTFLTEKIHLRPHISYTHIFI
jgi:hypothetical protein